MCKDALQRNESCGGHFREEYQTEEGEALRHDNNTCTLQRGNMPATATLYCIKRLEYDVIHPSPEKL